MLILKLQLPLLLHLVVKCGMNTKYTTTSFSHPYKVFQSSSFKAAGGLLALDVGVDPFLLKLPHLSHGSFFHGHWVNTYDTVSIHGAKNNIGIGIMLILIFKMAQEKRLKDPYAALIQYSTTATNFCVGM